MNCDQCLYGQTCGQRKFYEGGVGYGCTSFQRREMKLNYEDWLEKYGEELDIADAENGCDYEADFDQEAKREEQYMEYVGEGG